jgi:hypothetical protein
MELFSVTIALLAGFPLNLMAVTATSFLIPFAQPDGSTMLHF